MRKPGLGKWSPAIVTVALLFSQPLAAGVQRLEVTVADDWPADAFLDMGKLWCSGAELSWTDPVTPVCPGSGQLHLRRVAGYGCYTATSGGGIEPRLSGVGMFVVNGNLDMTYSGPVWGTWMVVPSAGCDPRDLIEPAVYWKGTWQGQRSMFCDSGACTWVGSLKLVGKGRGGDIEGIHLKGTEVITTFTPLPVPWELIPGFPFTGPEGVINGILKE